MNNLDGLGDLEGRCRCHLALRRSHAPLQAEPVTGVQRLGGHGPAPEAERRGLDAGLRELPSQANATAPKGHGATVDVHLGHVVVHQVVLAGSHVWVGVGLCLWGGGELVVHLLAGVNHLPGILHASPSSAPPSSDSEACVFLAELLSGVFHLEP